MRQRIGISKRAVGITVRGIRHFSECYVAMWPRDSQDSDCTCWDDSPDWTI